MAAECATYSLDLFDAFTGDIDAAYPWLRKAYFDWCQQRVEADHVARTSAMLFPSPVLPLSAEPTESPACPATAASVLPTAAAMSSSLQHATIANTAAEHPAPANCQHTTPSNETHAVSDVPLQLPELDEDVVMQVARPSSTKGKSPILPAPTRQVSRRLYRRIRAPFSLAPDATTGRQRPCTLVHPWRRCSVLNGTPPCPQLVLGSGSP